MPNIFVKVPEGTFATEELDKIAKGISEAVYKAESIPDNPRQRMLAWVMIEEIKAGHVFCGGKNIVPELVPVVVQFYPPEHVLDTERRALAAELVHSAILVAVDPSKRENILTSCMLLDVPDGHWGAQGRIWNVSHFAQAAGYEHLQHLASA